MRNNVFIPGSLISWRGDDFRISKIISLYTFLAENLETGELQSVPISEAKPSAAVASAVDDEPTVDLSDLTESEIREAENRYKIIESLLKNDFFRTRKHVEAVSAQSKVSVATLYRWIAAFERSNKLSSLIGRRRSDKGLSRIEDVSERILQLSIQERYLSDVRPSIDDGYMDFKQRCRAASVKPCSKSTFARRVSIIAPRELALRRRGPKAVREEFDPVPDNFKGGAFPLQTIQIDHTQPNVILVDDVYRKTIGRPWVTFAIDLYSRVIPGFHLSLAPPSATSVALCLSHAICRKEQWLASRGIQVDWPMWGLMDRVHADNGPDFRSNSVNRACKERDIRLTWRPLLKTEYGGHVERLMRTVKTDLANLQGTTFKNPEDRGEYDSEGKAIFTFSEFERWLVVYITRYYHARKHTGLDTSPLKKFEEGLLYGSDDAPPKGLPDPVHDEHRLYLDFLPYVERTVQRYGVEFDSIIYYHPSIARWIGVKSPLKSSKDGKHLFKFEDHQINFIYFYDPEIKDYLEIPRVRRSASNMTRHEWSLAKKKLREQGKENVDEEAIMQAHAELKSIEAESAEKTKSHRRNQQRKKEAVRATAHISSGASLPELSTKIINGFSSGPIKPFNELE